MDSPNLKLLKRLATACRKAGIESFEGYGFKFTLGEVYNNARKTIRSGPTSTKVNSDAVIPPADSPDELSSEALMFWSTGDLPEDPKES